MGNAPEEDDETPNDRIWVLAVLCNPPGNYAFLRRGMRPAIGRRSLSRYFKNNWWVSQSCSGAGFFISSILQHKINVFRLNFPNRKFKIYENKNDSFVVREPFCFVAHSRIELLFQVWETCVLTVRRMGRLVVSYRGLTMLRCLSHFDSAKVGSLVELCKHQAVV